MKTRKITTSDAKIIQDLIAEYAKSGIMLARPLNYIYENLRDYYVYEANGQIVACCALHIVWQDLAEVKSLAVAKQYQGKGIGNILVEQCLKEAKKLNIERVFALTYQVEFFKKINFKIIDKETLPRKVWGECVNCVKFTNCDEICMAIDL